MLSSCHTALEHLSSHPSMGGTIEVTWQEGVQFFLRSGLYFWTSVTSSLPVGGLGHRELLMFRVSRAPGHLRVLVAVTVSRR